MTAKNKTGKYAQPSLSEILALISDIDSHYSSKEIETAIGKLREAKRSAKKREEKEAARIQRITSMKLPASRKNVFNSDVRTRGVHAESIPDGLRMSLNTLGKVDIEYISAVTGADYKTVISALKGSIYQNPLIWNECFYQGWETAEEYLSGNLVRKWEAASEADKRYNGYFTDNIRAIEAVLPPAVTAKDIYITLGSPWVPADIIDQFIIHAFVDPFSHSLPASLKEARVNSMVYKTVHDEITGTWEIPNKTRFDGHVGANQIYGTDRLNGLTILEKTLNMKTVAVEDKISCSANASGKKCVINKAETISAIEKQQRLIKAFQEWVWTDDARRERLEKIYRANFSGIRKRKFDGSLLTFPTMSESIRLYPYQKDAVARIIFTPNTLLAHDVGAGKTYIMIAAGQEMRRMGLSTKNMYVVPNTIIGQWRHTFSLMYPQAKLLCVDPDSFTPNKRQEVLRRIRDEDYDGILIAYSCFEQIPLSKEYHIEQLKEQKRIISAYAPQWNQKTPRLRRKEAALEKALSNLMLAPDDADDTLYFDKLGITRLFVDEAHNFKNVPVETKTDHVLGISGSGSKRCQDMMDKVHMVQKKNGGKGVVLATGTPITNSITDAYIMQRYLQSDTLVALGLQSFDAWLGMFAERSTEFEIDVDASSYRLTTRFAKFYNLPELTALLSSIADFHQADASAGIPTHDGYHDALISRTDAFSVYLKDIAQRADAVHQGRVNRKEDNLLKITTDGRKAALDLRLVDSHAQFTYRSKVARCAENVADIYFKNAQT